VEAAFSPSGLCEPDRGRTARCRLGQAAHAAAAAAAANSRPRRDLDGEKTRGGDGGGGCSKSSWSRRIGISMLIGERALWLRQPLVLALVVWMVVAAVAVQSVGGAFLPKRLYHHV
jgi:hypothetical protein